MKLVFAHGFRRIRIDHIASGFYSETIAVGTDLVFAADLKCLADRPEERWNY